MYTNVIRMPGPAPAHPSWCARGGPVADSPDPAKEVRMATGSNFSPSGAGLAAPEPVAIVGIGCRLPGASGWPQFWRLLREGRDAITEIPPDRFDVEALFDPRPGTPGKMSTRWGGLIADITGFDAGFFGIAPREAVDLDPQHRLLPGGGGEAPESPRGGPAGRARRPTAAFAART